MFSHNRKQLEYKREQGLSILCTSNRDVILKNTPTQTSKRPQILPFNPLVGEKEKLSLHHPRTVHRANRASHVCKVRHFLALCPLRFYVGKRPLHRRIIGWREFIIWSKRSEHQELLMLLELFTMDFMALWHDKWFPVVGKVMSKNWHILGTTSG